MAKMKRKRGDNCSDICENCKFKMYRYRYNRYREETNKEGCLNYELCYLKKHGNDCCEWKTEKVEGIYDEIQDGLKVEEVDKPEKYLRHSDEIFRRMRWCAENGEKYQPANEKVHLIPDNIFDDNNFYFGKAPWNQDGSLNIQGIPPRRSENEYIPVGCGLLEEYIYIKNEEPTNKSKKLTKKQKDIEIQIKGNMKISSFIKK